MLFRRKARSAPSRPRPVASLPPLAMSVSVEAADCAAPVPSRVEDVVDDAVVLSAPTERGRPVRVQPGDRVLLRWVGGTGLFEMGAAVAATEQAPLPTWTVEPLEPARLTQRRETFRLPVRGEVSLTAGGDTVLAALVDLSEGGVGCRVSATSPVEPGQEVTVGLPLDDGALQLGASVVRVGAVRSGRRELGLCFAEVATRDAERLRGHLLLEQVRRRATAAV